MAVKPGKVTPFTYVNAINDHRQVDEYDQYVPFLVNRALSYHVDAILYANQINQLPDLDPDIQFAYYLNTLQRRKRFAKWAQPPSEKDLDHVCRHYNVNAEVGRQYIKILSKQQIKAIIDMRGENGKRSGGGNSKNK